MYIVLKFLRGTAVRKVSLMDFKQSCSSLKHLAGSHFPCFYFPIWCVKVSYYIEKDTLYMLGNE